MTAAGIGWGNVIWGLCSFSPYMPCERSSVSAPIVEMGKLRLGKANHSLTVTGLLEAEEDLNPSSLNSRCQLLIPPNSVDDLGNYSLVTLL